MMQHLPGDPASDFTDGHAIGAAKAWRAACEFWEAHFIAHGYSAHAELARALAEAGEASAEAVYASMGGGRQSGEPA